MLKGVASLLLANGYTEQSLVGAGALKGEKGDRGEPGVSMTGLEITDDNHLVVNLSNYKKLDAGELPETDIEISKAPGNVLKKMEDGSLFSSGSDAPFSSVDEESFDITESAQLKLDFEKTDINYETEF